MAKQSLVSRLKDELRAIGDDYKEVGRIAVYGRKKKKAKGKPAAKGRRKKAVRSSAKKAKTRSATAKHAKARKANTRRKAA